MPLPWGYAAAVFLGFAAWIDVRERRIPNFAVLGVAGLALLHWGVALALANGPVEAPGWREALLVFAVGALLHRRRIIGGGDVKLMAACALWFPEGLGGFLFATSCAGGVLALAAVGVGFGKGKKIAHIPYGLAIGVGAIIELNTKVFAAS